MNDDLLDDLKQFITAALAQQLTEIREDVSGLRSDIREVDKRLSAKIDDLAASIAEAMDTNTEATDAQLRDHEHRIGLLEQKAV